MSITTDNKTYKKDIVNRLGGVDQYNMAIMTFAERILEDSILKRFYKTVNFKDLCVLQREVLDLALMEMDEETRCKMETRVQLYHYRFFALGMKESHFDLMKDLLFESLLNSWAEPEVAEDALEGFEELRNSVFQNVTCPSGSSRRSFSKADLIIAAFAA